MEELLARFNKGEVRALSQLISLVENDAEEGLAILSHLYPRIGRAYRIGITGAPGSGKSSLIERIANSFLKENFSLGIVCVDPSSPFTGGAILGDRVRMASLFLEPKVYIRSMASRGSSGGLAFRTKEVCDILDAFGKDIILIETVGVGQVEIEIQKTAYTVIVVLVPESGDTIQTLKAGLLEIGDIFLINKSDREGADRLALELSATLKMKENTNWQAPVIKTCALTGEGVEEVFREIGRHRQYLTENGLLEKKRRENIISEIKDLTEEKIKKEIWEREEIKRLFPDWIKEIERGNLTPFTVSEMIIKMVKEEFGRRGNGEGV
ncbi:MAG: methylmalonyl Co-A mutase-associated GTPase MeaB [candidate division WOR-3 bacterium]